MSGKVKQSWNSAKQIITLAVVIVFALLFFLPQTQTQTPALTQTHFQSLTFTETQFLTQVQTPTLLKVTA